MLIRMREGATEQEIDGVSRLIAAADAQTRRVGSSLVVVRGGRAWMTTLAQSSCVEAVEPIASPYKLVARSVRPEGTTVRVGGVAIGARELVVIAGPCAVEDEPQMQRVASSVAAAGARLLRGGAFKPRTSPYTFQGLGERGLELVAAAGAKAGLPTVSEVMAPEDVPLVAGYVDMLQVGARSSQNFKLLEALGRSGKPVLLKRGMSTTVEELLLAAEHVMSNGNSDVVLCERGIRSFETVTRNTLDLNAVAALEHMTHLPVLVDPSHGTGRRALVTPMACAAVAAGAHGLMVEVHPDPDRALSDGAQSLTLEGFAALMRAIAGHAALCGRTVAGTRPESVERALVAYRGRIDAVDDAIVSLLNERASLAITLGRLKDAIGAPIQAPERECEVIARARLAATDLIAAPAIERVFASIMNEMRGLQRPRME